MSPSPLDDYLVRSGLALCAAQHGIDIDEATRLDALGVGPADVAALRRWSADDAGVDVERLATAHHRTVGDLYQTHLAYRLLRET